MSKWLALLVAVSVALIVACTKIPVADFSAQVTSGPAPLSVAFTDASKDGPKVWKWDFGDGDTSTQQSPTHEYKKAGTFTVKLAASNSAGENVATKEGLIIVKPGPLARIDLKDKEVVLAIGEGKLVQGSALDQFDNANPELKLAFKADPQAGAVDDQGNFKAGTKAGTFDSGITVEVSQAGTIKTAAVKVVVKPDPLARVTIAPESPSLNIGKSQQFRAQGVDQYGNPIAGLTYAYKADAGAVDSNGVLTAGTKSGSFAFSAEARQDAVTKTSSVQVAVLPDPLSEVTLTAAATSLSIGVAQQYQAQAYDQYRNPIPGLSYSFQADSSAGTVDSGGRFTPGTKAGNYTRALSVQVTQSGVSKSASADITIRPDPLDSVAITPATIALNIGGTQKYDAKALDKYGNVIGDVALRWKAQEGRGAITPDGVFTAGTVAGVFAEGVVAEGTQGSVTKSGKAQVNIKPDPLDKLALDTITVAAGATLPLAAKATDKYGNVIADAKLAWTVANANAGALDSTGQLAAGKVARTFAKALRVQAQQDTTTRSAEGDVVITPGPLDQVVVGPNLFDLGLGMTQQFVAVGADRYGNRIAGLKFTWSASDGGTISASGLFTAGATPGAFVSVVKASATQDTVSRSATASLRVLPDRIAFLSNRDTRSATIWDLYLMNSDGSSVRRITTGVGVNSFSWTPDGKRVSVGDASGDILVVSDDGSSAIDEISESYAVSSPAWSPDGRKIAFHSRKNNLREIYVADPDGGNMTRLTNNAANDDLPVWSPDGKLIAFISDRDGGDFEIYVMNADGSNQRRLTTAPGFDGLLQWSPDSKEIIFQSDRSGSRQVWLMNADGSNPRQVTTAPQSSNCPSFSPAGTKIAFHSFRDSDTGEIYVANRDGTNAVRLTNNTSLDYCPVWAPRKRGVDITATSLVIPNSSVLTPMTVQDVTATARKAVVRIESTLPEGTGVGSGSIIEPDGLILTANHVITGATKITVTLDDGTKYTATVVGRDMVRDLALIRIPATNLPTIPLGDTSQLPLGAQVVTVGFPLGTTSVTVTTGLASSFLTDAGSNVMWIQTDSAINPGNSGGPMLNLQGELVGIVTRKRSDAEGVGFAISVNTLKIYIDRMKAGETITL